MKIKKLVKLILIITAFVLTTSCSSNFMSNAPVGLQSNAASVYNTPLWEGNTADVWAKLQLKSSAKLLAMKNATTDPVKQAWLELAMISKKKNISTQHFASYISQWRTHYPNHPATALIPNGQTLSQLESQRPPRQIAVLLPESGPYAASGKAVREGFLNAYYANLPNVGKQNVKFYDTQHTQNMNMLYQRAFNEGADFIVGPLLKENVKQMSGGQFAVPVIALNYTNQFFSPPNNFYEYGLLPEDEASQIANRAREAGLSRALVVAPQNSWGKRLVSAFSSRWQSLGGHIQDGWYYEPNPDFNEGIARLLKVTPMSKDKNLTQKDNNKELLEHQRRQDFDVIFVFAQSADAHGIVPMLRYYFTGNIPIYASSAVYANKLKASKDVDLNGVIVCDIPWSIQRKGADEGVQPDRLYAVGQDAYLLSQSLQRLTQLNNFPIYGSTGALVLTSQHQIHRRMPCKPIRNGLA